MGTAAPRGADLDAHFARSLPTLTVLVPSYEEEPDVIQATLLSVALQEYPYLRIVLLIDDPPDPADERRRALLEAAWALPDEVGRVLNEPSGWFEEALRGFEARFATRTGARAPRHGGAPSGVRTGRRVARGARRSPRGRRPHPPLRLRAGHRAAARRPRAHGARDRGGSAERTVLPVERLRELYCRLAWTFRAELSSFERKQYASLSHDANKATNLNSYIGLMGGAFHEEVTPDGVMLQPANGTATLTVPEPDYILTLDADSVLLPEYCLRLVYFLEQPENANVGVAQTPYSSYPGAPTRLERIAGATTDLQHIAYQGLTYYGGTFWVGATRSCASGRWTTSWRSRTETVSRSTATSGTAPSSRTPSRASTSCAPVGRCSTIRSG